MEYMGVNMLSVEPSYQIWDTMKSTAPIVAGYRIAFVSSSVKA